MRFLTQFVDRTNSIINTFVLSAMELSQVSSTIADQFQLNFPSEYSYVVLLRFSESKLKQGQEEVQTESISKYELPLSHKIYSELLERIS